jgi:hypothetical protein
LVSRRRLAIGRYDRAVPRLRVVAHRHADALPTGQLPPVAASTT